jgi:hypothetical protein
MKWREGLFIQHGIGTIAAEEQDGRRYFYVRVEFPAPSTWWPRTTETGSVDEARSWIDEQAADWQRAVTTKGDAP